MCHIAGIGGDVFGLPFYFAFALNFPFNNNKPLTPKQATKEETQHQVAHCKPTNPEERHRAFQVYMKNKTPTN